jgi:heme-degrading monooxygenase HmoA
MMKLTRPPFPLRPRSLAVTAPPLLALALALGGCAVARPWSQPAAPPPSTGEAASGATVTLVITHAVLDGARRRPFDAYTGRVVEALQSGTVPGLIGFSVRKELLGDQVWTMSAWTDREASRRFAASSPHREAMEEASAAIRSVRVRHVERQRGAPPPRWEEALRWLEQPEGTPGGGT